MNVLITYCWPTACARAWRFLGLNYTKTSGYFWKGQMPVLECGRKAETLMAVERSAVFNGALGIGLYRTIFFVLDA